MMQVTNQIRYSYKFLSHLKLNSLFFFVEIDIIDLVSEMTYKKYEKILKERAKVRNQIIKEEKYYDNYIKNL
jgi:hypothetical protein